MFSHTKDLFQLQIELVDAKVDIAVSKASDRIIDRIDSLKTEVHGIKQDINDLKQDMNTRFAVVETKLGMRNKSKDEVHKLLAQYAFKALWFIAGSILSIAILYFHKI